jgi:hypothetical protein
LSRLGARVSATTTFHHFVGNRDADRVNAQSFEGEALERRAAMVVFDGGTITSNAGALPLRQVDRQCWFDAAICTYFTNRRDPRYR